jgi:hypothetical protein
MSFQVSIKDGNHHTLCTEASAGVNSDKFGVTAEAKCGTSLYKYSDNDGDIRLLSGRAGAKAAANIFDGLKAKAEARYDLIDVETKVGLKSRVGISIDTGGSIGSNGVEAKVAGFGLKVGKEIGLSTPIGEISWDLGKLV